MRVFKTRDFARFARRERITDAELCEAVARAESGLIDAVLGGGLIKQRIPRRGQGRSGGFRTIIAYRHRDRSVFFHGFAKSAQDNVTDDELKQLKAAASQILGLSPAAISKALEDGRWIEVHCDG